MIFSAIPHWHQEVQNRLPVCCGVDVRAIVLCWRAIVSATPQKPQKPQNPQKTQGSDGERTSQGRGVNRW